MPGPNRIAIIIELADRIVRPLDKINRGFGSFKKNVAGLRRELGPLAGTLTTVGAAFATIRLSKLGQDLEETRNKFREVLKELVPLGDAFVDEIAEKVGRSRIELQEFVATLQNIFVPLGFARDKAFELSTELTKLAIDVASFNNKTDAEVVRDFSSALVGNTEAIRKYGIVITETRLKQEALNRGLDPKVLTEQEKAWLRFQLIVASSKDAIGDAERTSDSFANQMKRLRANLVDSGAVLGRIINDLLLPFVQRLNEIGPGLAEWVQQNRLTIESVLKLVAAIAALLVAAKVFTILAATSRVLNSLSLGTIKADKAFRGLFGALKSLALAALIAEVGSLTIALLNANGAVERLDKSFRSLASGEGSINDVIAELRTTRDQLIALGDNPFVKFNPVAVALLGDQLDQLHESERAVVETALQMGRTLETFREGPRAGLEETGEAFQFLSARAEAAEKVMATVSNTVEAFQIVTDESAGGLLRLVEEFGVTEEAALALARQVDRARGIQLDAAESLAGLLQTELSIRRIERDNIRFAAENAELEQERLKRIQELTKRVEAARQAVAKQRTSAVDRQVDDILSTFEQERADERSVLDQMEQTQALREEAFARIRQQEQDAIALLSEIDETVGQGVESSGLIAIERLSGALDQFDAETRAKIEALFQDLRNLGDERATAAAAFDAAEARILQQSRDREQERVKARQEANAAIIQEHEELVASLTSIEDQQAALATGTSGVQRRILLDNLRSMFAAGEVSAREFGERFSELVFEPLSARRQEIAESIQRLERQLQGLPPGEHSAELLRQLIELKREAVDLDTERIQRERELTQEMEANIQRQAAALNGLVGGPLTSFVETLITGTESIREAFGNLLRDLGQQIARFVAQALVQRFILAIVGGGGAGAAGGAAIGAALNAGGTVPGSGPDRDSVPAMLTPGEYVLRRDAVKRYGLGFLHALNAGMVPRGLLPAVSGHRPSMVAGRWNSGGPVAGGGAAQVLPAIAATEGTMDALISGGRPALLRFFREHRSEIRSQLGVAGG